MSGPFRGIHSAVVLVHLSSREFPVHFSGYSDWISEPSYEDYATGVIRALVNEGVPGAPGVTKDDLRMVELNFSIIEHEE